MTFPVLCDLDGVVWLAHRPIPGSVEAIARLRAAGHRVLFVTNFSFATLGEHVAALEALGIPAAGDVVSSAGAAGLLVAPGERVLVCAGPGVAEAVRRRGAEVVDSTDVDAVVVGFHRSFDYEVMRQASEAVRRGARFVGTNDDSTYPTPEGPIPGGGAILASIAVASGVAPEIAGKPYAPMGALVRSVIGDDAVAGAVMVGDRADTDGRFARTLGCRFALVHSGVTPAGATVDPVPDLVAADLAALVDQLGA